MKKLNQTKGITLIALIITIIVLLILAGVTISMLTGDNGILKNAQLASQKQKEEELKEKINLILAEGTVEKMVKDIELIDFLNNKKDEYNISEIKESDDKKTITILLDGYKVIIDAENHEILKIIENTEFLDVALSAKTAKLNEEIEAIVTLGSEISIQKWAYIAEETDTPTLLGTEKESYSNEYIQNPIKLIGTEQKTYYLHLLTQNKKNGKLTEEIVGPIKVGNYITNIVLNKTEMSLNIGEKETLSVVTISPDDATDKTVKWMSSNSAVAEVNENTGEITAISAGVAIVTAIANDGSGIKSNCTVKVIRGGAILLDSTKYSWENLNKIAKIISDNYGTGEGKYNKSTKEVTVTLDDGEEYTIMVGDTVNLTDESNNNYIVRILGFNHDELAETATNAYGGENKYAGISFEFVTYLNTSTINNGGQNTGGWESSTIKNTLNNTTIETLRNKDYIKLVKKSYISSYNNGNSLATNNYKLWLLAASEIFTYPLGSNTAYAYFSVVESTMHGENDTQVQYKFYADGGSRIKESIDGNAYTWWLRTVGNGKDHFIAIYPENNGGYSSYGTGNRFGIAPGFSI